MTCWERAVKALPKNTDSITVVCVANAIKRAVLEEREACAEIAETDFLEPANAPKEIRDRPEPSVTDAPVAKTAGKPIQGSGV